ncbi:MAG: NAD-dependent epimerase/dehydratase [Candidatus Gottesmanbacteria bacterium GW2011_GWC2_39_8]|uniref:NAD-dependent epimerase/dehydratase n=1 Tax=Candidatus Gottesmanbacteria bacterium GW2011_GWC2_39_8 TaxID=1618450 RepID=A0A0G0PVF4_9BACT|nr:MAG: NAD-dependent epimerase/dehydratase [Candidatus Gottesmanbacteria bacterium GW2011_GWC2_39_8]
MKEKILVTGAFGLVGTDLVIELKKKYGQDNIITLSHNTLSPGFEGIVENGDVRDPQGLDKTIKKYGISQVYHLAGLLSVGSEKDPNLAWDVNLGGLKNVLDVAVAHKLKVFWPSSIAAFGSTTPKNMTPQHTILESTTMYGVNKVSGELLCRYYNLRYGLDVRSLRYPGLTGYKAPPGNGTTEYSVHIFYGAIQEKHYTCFLSEDTVLPMMYIDDAIKGTMDLMEASSDKLSVRTSYNFAAISFAPLDIVNEIKKLIPEFTCDFLPDQRQKIADSWPKTIDDSVARNDWGWKPEYDLEKMTKVMLEKLKEKLGKNAEVI